MGRRRGLRGFPEGKSKLQILFVLGLAGRNPVVGGASLSVGKRDAVLTPRHAAGVCFTRKGNSCDSVIGDRLYLPGIADPVAISVMPESKAAQFRASQ